MAKEDIGGIWRTVGGRRIFIKDGEDLETAMKNSGKFGKKKMEENGGWKREEGGVHKREVDGETHYIQGVKKANGTKEYTTTIYDKNGDEIASKTFSNLEEAQSYDPYKGTKFERKYDSVKEALDDPNGAFQEYLRKKEQSEISKPKITMTDREIRNIKSQKKFEIFN